MGRSRFGSRSADAKAVQSIVTAGRPDELASGLPEAAPDQLRADRDLAATPVVAVTGHAPAAQWDRTALDANRER